MQTDAELAERSFDAEFERDPDGPVASADRAMSSGGVMAKHTVDFALALLGVICLLPVIGLVALLIKLDSPGPVFFRQKRVGRDGKAFDIFKFRTMVQGAYLMGSRLTVKRDPRITRLGRLLRWSKIDELPQLFNVLRGDMSLIGPRPEDPHFVKCYSPAQRRVLLVRPGLVGPSQIQGRDEVDDYPEGLKDTETYYVTHILPPKLQRDIEYVEGATFWSDMGLLVHGVWATVRGAFKAKYLWRRRRRIALMGVDLVLAVGAYALALLMRFDWQWPDVDYTYQTVALVAILQPPLLVYFGAYQGIASYFGLWDLVALFKAVTAGSIAAAGVTYFVGSQSHPRSVFAINGVLLLLMLFSSRYILRVWARRHPRRGKHMRAKAIIVGAGSGGEQMSRALVEDPSSGYEPIGFIDESLECWGSRIHGIKVFGGTAELPLALSANKVGFVFVCLSDVTAATAGEVADICTAAGVDYRMLPALSELLHAGSSINERRGLPDRQPTVRLV
jgi:lipopolysaccharide/colanic/teichoic acid biosynthesis glycosyltransferase